MADEISPRECAQQAQVALEAYNGKTGSEIEDGTALIDLLADLMHWADENEIIFELALGQADKHYRDEAPNA